MTTVPVTGAGPLLRQWRERRRLSQLDLSHLAGTSARHLSCLETGRARPSPQMVLRLGEALAVPLADRNAMLLAAGHAPAYADSRQDRAATRRLLDVLDLALAAYAPWPALVLDAQFDVVAGNDAVDRLLTLVDGDLLDPAGQRRTGHPAPARAVPVHRQPRRLARAPAAPGASARGCDPRRTTWTPCCARRRATRRPGGRSDPTTSGRRSRSRWSWTWRADGCGCTARSRPSARHWTSPPASSPSRRSCPPTSRPESGWADSAVVSTSSVCPCTAPPAACRS